MQRLSQVNAHFGPTAAAGALTKDSLSVKDNRTGKEYTLAIKDGAINATDLSKIKSPAGAVTRSYDPAYMNTVNCISRISFINGEKGILEYRGYPIEQLAEKSNFLETTFLLINGELPTPKQLQSFTKKVMKNSAYHDGLEPFIKAFRHDAHPMAMMSTLMAAMSSFYPEANPAYVGANIYKTRQERNKHIYRVIGSAPAIAAACYRHRIGKPIIPPKEDLTALPDIATTSYESLMTTSNVLTIYSVATNSEYAMMLDAALPTTGVASMANCMMEPGKTTYLCGAL